MAMESKFELKQFAVFLGVSIFFVLWANLSAYGEALPVQKQKSKPKGAVKTGNKTPDATDSLYLSLIGSIQEQDARALQTDADGTYQFTKFTGSAPVLSMGRQLYFSKSLASIVGLTFRRVDLKGKGKNSENTTESEYQLTTDSFGVEMGLKYSQSSSKGWSLLALFEATKEYKTKLEVLSGPKLDNTKVESKNQASLFLGVSYSVPVFQNWILEPGFRGGTMVSAQPVIIFVEGFLTFRHRI